MLSHFRRVQLSVTPWTIARQAPLSMKFSDKSTGGGGRSLLQGVFLTQGPNPGFLHCRHILYHLSHLKVEDILSPVCLSQIGLLSQGIIDWVD